MAHNPSDCPAKPGGSAEDFALMTPFLTLGWRTSTCQPQNILHRETCPTRASEHCEDLFIMCISKTLWLPQPQRPSGLADSCIRVYSGITLQSYKQRLVEIPTNSRSFEDNIGENRSVVPNYMQQLAELYKRFDHTVAPIRHRLLRRYTRTSTG